MKLEITNVEPVPVASVTRRAQKESIAESIGDGIGTVMAALERRGLEPLGPPLCAYPEPMVDGEPMTVVIAVPIEPGVPSLEDIELQTIPGGRVAAVTHVGSYAGLDAAYQEMAAAMNEQGLRPTAGPREIYLNDSDYTPEADLLTRIEFPIAM